MRTALFASLTLAGMASFAATAPQDTVRATVNAQGVQVVDVKGGGYFFQPRHIVVKANVPLELRVRKEPGMVPHNIVIDAPEAAVQVREEIGEQPRTIRLTFSKPGKYTFYCSKKLLFLASHKDRGMAGTIEVVE